MRLFKKNSLKCVIFHHYNARQHVPIENLQSVNALKWQIFQHPPYYSDLAHSDFQFLQNNLNCKTFFCTVSWKLLENFFPTKNTNFLRKWNQQTCRSMGDSWWYFLWWFCDYIKFCFNLCNQKRTFVMF